MLTDRPYMRDDYPKRGRTALMWLLSGIASGFVLVTVFERMFDSGVFVQWFQLSFTSLKHGLLWQLASYSFIHPLAGTLSVLVVAFNLFCLYLLGHEIESLLGARRFLVLYFGAVILGAGCWLAVNYQNGGALTGAWPGIVACLTLLACLNPNQEKQLLVMFVLPVTIRLKYLVWTLFLVELCGLGFLEMRGQHLPLQISPSAHLGGMLAGYLYFVLVHKREWRNPDGRTNVELPNWMRRKQKNTSAAKYKVNLTAPPAATPQDLKAEVDRILDKINSQGFSALTPEEKRLLDDARDQLGRN